MLGSNGSIAIASYALAPTITAMAILPIKAQHTTHLNPFRSTSESISVRPRSSFSSAS